MVTSTWGPWFVRDEIEGADVNSLSLWYLGCNGFVVRSANATLYVDPYFGRGRTAPYAARMIPVPLDPVEVSQCDAVFVTHEHQDHMHPPSFDPLLAEDGRLYAPPHSLSTSSTPDVAVPEERRVPVEPGDSHRVGDIQIHVFTANDPDAVDPVSYVFEHDSGVFVHTGDSRPTDAFERIGESFDVDLAALAFGSVGVKRYPDRGPTIRKLYMDEGEVIEAANALRADRIVPTHWDMWKGFTANPAAVREHARSHPNPRHVEVVTIGDRLVLDRDGVVTPRGLRCPTRRSE